MVVGVVRSNLNGGPAGGALYPTAEALLEVGMHQVYEPPVGAKFDVVECAANLKTIESQQNLRFLGVVPCREAAVDFSDILGALLGLTVVNDLGLASARRDKGLMKVAVANAGLRVARYARLTAGNGEDVAQAVEELELDYPVVVKTPRGMSTMGEFRSGEDIFLGGLSQIARKELLLMLLPDRCIHMRQRGGGGPGIFEDCQVCRTRRQEAPVRAPRGVHRWGGICRQPHRESHDAPRRPGDRHLDVP